MSEESPLNIFDPVYFDEALLDNPPPPPRHRRAKRMPGTLLPVLLKTGDFWVPDVWRLRANATEAVNACRVRRSIVRDVPPIDFEALVELGEFIGLDADSGREFHVQMAAPNFVYTPKVVIFRESDGGLMIVMAVPGGTLIVPRRAPRESAGAPDLRDDFEVVCVFDHEGLFYAAPLAACWRFALAWGPNVPLAAELSLALQARDASFLTPPKAPHFRRLEVEVTFRLDAEHAQRFIDDLYVQARSGAFVVVGGSGPPEAIVQIRPMDKTRWIAELAFDYDGLVVPPADSPHSEDSVGRERHLVRDFMAEDLALETLTGLLGEPDEFGCVWVIARRRVQALRETLAAIQQEHGWRVEMADEPIASAMDGRLSGLSSEVIFRPFRFGQLNADGERSYQHYTEQTRKIAAQEADEIAKALAETLEDAVEVPERVDGRDAATRSADACALRDLIGRGLELHVAYLRFEAIELRWLKVVEIRRLLAVQGQSRETLDTALEVAASLVAASGHVLFAHQRDALRGVLFRLWAGQGAILALPVGYGKTLVALLAAVMLKRFGVVVAPVLWVGTKSTLVSLRSDLRRFMPELKVNDFTGPNRVALFEGIDLVMTSYDFLRRDSRLNRVTGLAEGVLMEATWGLLVADEVSVAANPLTLNFEMLRALRERAQRVLLLNATMLENTTVDVWSHLELMSPRGYGIAIRATRDDEALEKPGPESDQVREVVRRNIFAYAVDEKQCSGEDIRLPSVTWRAPVLVPISPEHAASMTAFLVIAAKYMRLHKDSSRTLGAVTRLRRACHAPRYLSKSGEVGFKVGPTPRARAIADLVAAEWAAGHHCLVFSSWLDTLKVIADHLTERGLAFDLFAGPTELEQRTVLAKKWGDGRQPPQTTPALLLQPMAGGRGLNLVGADRVIFAEPFWNPALMQQCVGRAHRMGQLRPVEVIVFTSEALIEQVVERRAEAKRRLAEAIFGGDRLPTEVAVSAWTECHAVLGYKSDTPIEEHERQARIAELLAVLEHAEELSLDREAAAAGLPAREHEIALGDARIELLNGPLSRPLNGFGNAYFVTHEDVEAVWRALSPIWERLTP